MYKQFLAILAVGCSAAPKAAVDARELMARSIQVAEINWKEAPNYSFLRTAVNSKRSSRPVTTIQEVLMIDGSPYLRTMSEDGQPLVPQRAQEEEQKLQRESARRENESARERRRRIEKYTEDRNRDYTLLKELCEAFDYQVTGEQNIGGNRVWVLEGKPKPSYVAKTRETKVLTGMNVAFWIDQKTYQWLRVEAEVMQPVSLYGSIAKVGPGTKLVLEQTQVSPGLWMPKHFSMQVKASALGFINQDSTQDETYSNYQLGGPSGSALSQDVKARPRQGAVLP